MRNSLRHPAARPTRSISTAGAMNPSTAFQLRGMKLQRWSYQQNARRFGANGDSGEISEPREIA